MNMLGQNVGSAKRRNGFHGSLLFAVSAVAALFAIAAPANALAAPSAMTEGAGLVHRTSAVLNGYLDPSGDPGVVSCQFEWGETEAYGHTQACSEGNSFTSPANVSASLGGLEPETTYHFRLDVETTSSGTLHGADLTFETAPPATAYEKVASFGPDGTSATSFDPYIAVPFGDSGLSKLAFDGAARRLYALEGGAPGIYGFDVSSPLTFAPLAAFAPHPTPPIEIGPQASLVADNTGLPSAGNLYFSTAGEVEEVFGLDAGGNPLPGFPVVPEIVGASEICGMAVDPSGSLWVVDLQDRQIFKYSSTGALQSTLEVGVPAGVEPGAGEPCGIAFDPAGHMYLGIGNGGTYRLNPPAYSTTSATFVSPVFPGYLDPATGDLLAAGANVRIFDPNGRQLAEFARGPNGNPTYGGITADPVNGYLYVSNYLTQKIEAYAPVSAIPPTVNVGAASGVGPFSATLEGAVDPEGSTVGECSFEYFGVPDFPGSGGTAPCSPAPGSGSGNVPVSGQLTGLIAGKTYRYRLKATSPEGTGWSLYGTFSTPPPPEVSAAEAVNIGLKGAELTAKVNPRGYSTSYRFEWGTTNAYGNVLPVPEGEAGSGTSPVAVSVPLSGLEEDAEYHFRLVANSANGTVTTPDVAFRTAGPATVETTGSPVRSATTVHLESRVDPDGLPTTYRFEYGTQGPCSANPCASTEAKPGGAGKETEFVSEEIEGLSPGTTYHYRIVAESAAASPVGEDMTVTTRESDAPLSHGRLPGPPGSDRAWEQVNAPDTGGNPVTGATAISDNGERVVYQIAGGNSLSEGGSLYNQLFAERTPAGWVSKKVYPTREQATGNLWLYPAGSSDLSTLAAVNFGNGAGGKEETGWLLRPDSPASKLFGVDKGQWGNFLAVSENGERIVAALRGSEDPQHPNPEPETPQLYDVSSGTPKLISLLPDGSVSCGLFGLKPALEATRFPHWVSGDGSLAFFASCGGIYMREIEAGATKLISAGNFIKATPGAVFTADGGDIYRYDIATEADACLTCFEGGSAGVSGSDDESVAVAEDGSRVYFTTGKRLLPGASRLGIYRVDVASGDLAYVAPGGGLVGDVGRLNEAINRDGSVLVFASSSPLLNPIGGTENGGTLQIYRYDDKDRSLVCISCPADGSPPRGEVERDQRGLLKLPELGPNLSAVDDAGDVLFSTPTALAPGDENTAASGEDAAYGTDVYEWRDGRQLLVSDGLTSTPPGYYTSPEPAGITPSGRDAFFTVAAQLTPDALDAFPRLYDARIGGGFEFERAPAPCPLEACQGTPQATPEEPTPGSTTYQGAGNPPKQHSRCPKGNVRAHGRCVKHRHRSKKHKRKHRGRHRKHRIHIRRSSR